MPKKTSKPTKRTSFEKAVKKTPVGKSVKKATPKPTVKTAVKTKTLVKAATVKTETVVKTSSKTAVKTPSVKGSPSPETVKKTVKNVTQNNGTHNITPNNAASNKVAANNDTRNPTQVSPKPVLKKLPPDEHLMQMMEKLRTLLLARRDAILKNIDDERDVLDEVKGDGVGDVVDIAQDSTEHELSFQLAEFGSRELGQIDLALEKIAEGTYGVCEICGGNISIARIKALPFASKCIKCQQQEEGKRNGN